VVEPRIGLGMIRRHGRPQVVVDPQR
jgi:hypothetical protein